MIRMIERRFGSIGSNLLMIFRQQTVPYMVLIAVVVLAAGRNEAMSQESMRSGTASNSTGSSISMDQTDAPNSHETEIFRRRHLFDSVRSDPIPAKLCANSHFVVSDESDHWLFRKDLAVSGGAFLGVGTDNNYTMAGWSRPDYLVLMDFDQVVVDVHRVYRAAFLAAPTPQKFLSLWATKSQQELREIVVKAYPQPEVQKGVLNALKIGRRLIDVRLKAQSRKYRAMGIPTFMDDPVQYRFVVDLFRNSRVLLVRGDLTGKMAMKDIARVLKDLDVPVRVLNLSNTEAYFDYVPSYRENIAALPMDENTLILSTSISTVDDWVAQGNYRYFIQKGTDYRAWLDRPSVRNSKVLRPRRVKGADRGLNYLLAPPPLPASKTVPNPSI